MNEQELLDIIYALVVMSEEVLDDYVACPICDADWESGIPCGDGCELRKARELRAAKVGEILDRIPLVLGGNLPLTLGG